MGNRKLESKQPGRVVVVVCASFHFVVHSPTRKVSIGLKVAPKFLKSPHFVLYSQFLVLSSFLIMMKLLLMIIMINIIVMIIISIIIFILCEKETVSKQTNIAINCLSKFMQIALKCCTNMYDLYLYIECSKICQI